MILVDSSVWIEYFKNSRESVLTNLIIENLVCTNEVILSELIPFALFKKETEMVEGLYALPKIELEIDWNSIKLMQLDNLKNGLNKIGIPDIIIAQQAIQQKVKLWTLDKHFKFMTKYLNFDLFEMKEIN